MIAITDDEVVDQLVSRQPLALLVSVANDGQMVTPLPLILQREEGGRSVLIGHMARANSHVAVLRANPRALAIFLGPNHYLSPSWLDDRSQAPTWYYAAAYIEIAVEFDDSSSAALGAVKRLTEHMEAGGEDAWQVDEMGARADRLMPHIVAFRASVLEMRTRYKLGQADRDDVFEQALVAFERLGEADLVAAMKAVNAKRSASLVS
jgi:transcriptional regulator